MRSLCYYILLVYLLRIVAEKCSGVCTKGALGKHPYPCLILYLHCVLFMVSSELGRFFALAAGGFALGQCFPSRISMIAPGLMLSLCCVAKGHSEYTLN